MSKKKTEQHDKSSDDSSADAIADMLNADSDFYGDDSYIDTEEVELTEAAIEDDRSDPSDKTSADYQRICQEQQTKIAALETTLKKKEAEFLSACAEVKNIQQRAVKDVQKAHQFGNERLIKELLDVIDSLERALSEEANQADSTSNTIIEGVQLTLDLFLSTLAKFGVDVVDPQGQAFDPQLHEAMSMQPSEEHESGTVMMTIQKGYSLHGRLVRPARVIVAK